MGYDLRELLRHADQKGYAIPAFNYSDSWELLAIVEAAREERAPVICQSHARVLQVWSEQWLGGLGRAVMEQTAFPVFNHLDHCASVEVCQSAIDAGYPSVMFDGSLLPLEENIAQSRRVVAHARKHNSVCVEGEIGRIRGNSEEGTYLGNDFLVRVEDAIRMAEESGVDSLAVGIGNAHGFYLQAPQLNFARLVQVNDAVSIPLVLHGSSGIPDRDIQQAVRCGINKVNVGTELHAAYLLGLRSSLSLPDNRADILAAMIPAKENIKAVVRRWIRLCMADHRF